MNKINGLIENGSTLIRDRVSASNEYHSEAYYPSEILADLAKADYFRQNNRSQNTLRMYKRYWKKFVSYCAGELAVNSTNFPVSHLPADPNVVAAFLAYLSRNLEFDNSLSKGKSLTPSNSTYNGVVAAINYVHNQAGYLSPTTHIKVKETLRGLLRSPDRKLARNRKSALVNPYLVKLISYLDSIDQTLTTKRNRAILLLGRQGGFRRSELASLKVNDLTFRPDALIVQLRFHKTSKDGSNAHTKVLPVGEEFSCVDAVADWIESAKIESGHLFRSFKRTGDLKPYIELNDYPDDELPLKKNTGYLHGNDIYRIVKKVIKDAGLTMPKQFGAHSLRSGLVTQMFIDNKQSAQIKKRSGHKTSAMLDEYNQVE
ncbi:tyrosine-type recombinase/integrase (plasmid) [Shewanella xiamenensis]|uniref:Tyrosine-type recombinase/integrase n=1 Tax=Shewanella xiamenensis TaxID=332186 RepID=A0ABT6UDS7_9GAMM|nr:tyrosine-type recombinase/integrase [Shewanella xiamenensis]MDI5832626.1 tyrosine-type recombinase/integrase [Shewanella xiamenensis]WHF57757.1 tyrosine-type recombinase/integrase [Shewanella xiamenensis]